ncbi:unnamed protein product [Rangifer tarandus platyrhynchus]|uniref:Uncharacterized protein n=1 Tax=Rangifer tarandus platyrhynchus TaxID=3082113 RepID=A0ABN8Z546_RANTA|nr:unnamed protein product [Rangifer tarandus platyrhynchus]
MASAGGRWRPDARGVAHAGLPRLETTMPLRRGSWCSLRGFSAPSPGLWNLLAAEGEFGEQVPPEASPRGPEPPAWASPWQQHTSKPVLPVATERAAPRTRGSWREDFTVGHTPSASAPPCATLLGDAMGHRVPATAGVGGSGGRLLICRLANEAVFVTLKPRGLIQKRRNWMLAHSDKAGLEGKSSARKLTEEWKQQDQTHGLPALKSGEEEAVFLLLPGYRAFTPQPLKRVCVNARAPQREKPPQPKPARRNEVSPARRT